MAIKLLLTSRQSHQTISVPDTFMIGALIGNVIVLFLFIVFLFIFTGIGLAVRSRLPAGLTSGGELLFISFGIGTAVTGYAVFLLAAANLLYPAILYLLSGLLCAIAAAGWRKSGPACTLRNLRPASIVECLAASLLAILLAAALLMSLAPETGRDALIYHLAAPKLFLKHHGFCFTPGNPLAQGPFHTEMLFMLALFLKGDVLAKLINFAFLLAILLGIRQFAVIRWGKNGFPYLCMLVFAMIPSVFNEMHTAYIDLAVTFSIMAALYAFLRWDERKERGWLFLSALFTGIALASKYTTLLLPAVGVLGLLLGHRDD